MRLRNLIYGGSCQRLEFHWKNQFFYSLSLQLFKLLHNCRIVFVLMLHLCLLWYFLFQIFVPIFQSHQVLSNYHTWLGGSWTSSLSPGLQHVEPTDSQKEPQLSSSGLQLQSETSQNSHNKGKKKVKIWKCFPSLSWDPSTHKAGHRFPCSVQIRQCRQLSGEKENIECSKTEKFWFLWALCETFKFILRLFYW